MYIHTHCDYTETIRWIMILENVIYVTDNPRRFHLHRRHRPGLCRLSGPHPGVHQGDGTFQGWGWRFMEQTAGRTMVSPAKHGNFMNMSWDLNYIN